ANHFKEAVGYVVNRPTGTRDYLITLTISGTGIYRMGDQSRLCKRGDIMILTPGTPHHYSTFGEQGSVEPWEFVWSHFLPPEDWQAYLELPETLPGLLQVQLQNELILERLLHAFHRLIQDQLQGDLLHERLAYLALEEILVVLATQSGDKHGRNAAMDPRVEVVKQQLLLHMREP